jgi:hypothetical protein
VRTDVETYVARAQRPLERGGDVGFPHARDREDTTDEIVGAHKHLAAVGDGHLALGVNAFSERPGQRAVET